MSSPSSSSSSVSSGRVDEFPSTSGRLPGPTFRLHGVHRRLVYQEPEVVVEDLTLLSQFLNQLDHLLAVDGVELGRCDLRVNVCRDVVEAHFREAAHHLSSHRRRLVSRAVSIILRYIT